MSGAKDHGFAVGLQRRLQCIPLFPCLSNAYSPSRNGTVAAAVLPSQYSAAEPKSFTCFRKKFFRLLRSQRGGGSEIRGNKGTDELNESSFQEKLFQLPKNARRFFQSFGNSRSVVEPPASPSIPLSPPVQTAHLVKSCPELSKLSLFQNCQKLS